MVLLARSVAFIRPGLLGLCAGILALAASPASAQVPDGIALLEDQDAFAVVAPDYFAGVGLWGVGNLDDDFDDPEDILFNIPVPLQTWAVEFGDDGIYNLADAAQSVDWQVTDTNGVGPTGDDRVDTLFAAYTLDEAIFVDATATLRGTSPGTGISDLAETIRIFNGYDDEELHGYFYQSVVLFGDPVPVNPNTVSADVFGGVFDEVVTPEYDGFMPGVPLDAIGEELVALLVDFLGEEILEEGIIPFGFTLVWEFDVAPGETWLLSKDKRIDVPEPGIAVLLGLGLAGLTVAGRRRH